MAKFYAVAKGKSGEPKIFSNWEECKKEVIGAKGAIYKSFQTEREAKAFIELHSHGVTEKTNAIKNNDFIEDEERYIHIYVDGSFREELNNYSYGLVVVDNNKVIYEDRGRGVELEAISMRNVAGEVLGAMKAVEFAENNNYEKIKIFFDYQGIESWALGTWKRNNFLTERYHNFMKEKMEKINVKFVKVKGHSGVEFNERADRLAAEAFRD